MVIDLKLLGVALKNYHPYLFLNFYQQYENFNFYDKSELKDSTIYIIDSQDFVVFPIRRAPSINRAVFPFCLHFQSIN